MSSPQVCLVREGRIYSLRRGGRNSIFDHCSSGVNSRFLKEVFRDMRDSIRRYMLLFRRMSRRVFGFPLRIESPPPDVLGDKVFTGFWTGVYEYSGNGNRVWVIVEPQVRRYDEMIFYVNRVLGGLSNDFRLVADFSFSTSTSLALTHMLKRILLELSILVDREPKRIYSLVEERSGEIITIDYNSLDNMNKPLYRVYKQVYRPNTRLHVTTILVLRNIMEALRKLVATREHVEAAIRDMGLEQHSRYRSLSRVIDYYIENIRRYIRILLGDENLRFILSRHIDLGSIDEFEVYDHIVVASNKLRRGVEFETEGLGRARQLFFPSTKIYELYVYADIVESISESIGKTPLYEKVLTTTIDGRTKIRLYFNHYPEELSRIIARITRRKTPQPDILFYNQYRNKIVIIDAKYRYLDSGKPRLLGLGDAERIAAYLIDAAKNNVLEAIIVSLSRPPDNVLERIKQGIRPLNSKKIVVEFVELNPDHEKRVEWSNLLN